MRTDQRQVAIQLGRFELAESIVVERKDFLQLIVSFRVIPTLYAYSQTLRVVCASSIAIWPRLSKIDAWDVLATKDLTGRSKVLYVSRRTWNRWVAENHEIGLVLSVRG